MDQNSSHFSGFVPNNPRWFGDICHFELDRKQKNSLIAWDFPNMLKPGGF